jgi:hypothetical protein
VTSHSNPPQQELIGLSMLAKRKAHAEHYNMSIAESQKLVPLTELLRDPLFARYGTPLNGNGTSVGSNR